MINSRNLIYTNILDLTPHSHRIICYITFKTLLQCDLSELELSFLSRESEGTMPESTLWIAFYIVPNWLVHFAQKICPPNLRCSQAYLLKDKKFNKKRQSQDIPQQISYHINISRNYFYLNTKFRKRGANMRSKDKILGVIYGQAIGDAIGMPSELWPVENIRDQFG